MLEMNSRMRERLIVITAAILFFAAFGAVAYFDRPHGTVGTEFGEGDFTADVEKNQGHMSIPELPSDLMVLGAGQDTSLDFTVQNQDEDNDIDTVYINIPGSTILDGSTEWYIPTEEHEWNLTTPSDDVAKFTAVDDLPGRVFGGSSQYDVAGNIDDALDHSKDEGISEAITITLDFTAPATAGARTGNSAIDLQVADEQTEPEDGTTPQRFSQEPFPYPYLVLDTDHEFYLFSFESQNADLAIDYGNERLFSTGTRASDFLSSEYGFKYTATDGSTKILLDAPDDDVSVTPVITAESDGGGTYTIDMVHYRTVSIVPTAELEVINDQVDYTGDLPETAGELDPPLDGDGDGLFLDNDDDWDNDGVPNDEDTSPFDNTIANHRPVFEEIQKSATEIPANKELTLTAVASDVETDPADLVYTWSVDEDPSWSDSGRVITVTDFEPGTYTFHVTISDGSDETVEGQTTVVIAEAEEEPSFPIIWIIIIVVLAIIIIAVLLYFVTRGREEEEEEPEELPPDVEAGMPQPGAESMDYEIGAVPPPSEVEPVMPQPEAVGVMEQETYEEPLQEEEVVEETVPPGPPAAEEESVMDEDSELEEVQDLESLMQDMERTEEEMGDVCPECGSPLGPYDTQCGSCGAQFEIALECPNCGAVIEEKVDTCPNCGVQFQ